MTKLYQEEKNIHESICKFFESILKKKLLESEEKLCNNNNVEVDGRLPKFIDLLLEERNEFTFEEIRDHMRAIVYGVT
jgi:hypothetical protein